ncbi:acetamidase [Apiospora arundinis]
MDSTYSVPANPESWQEKPAKKRISCQKAIPTAWTLPKSILESLPEISGFPTTRLNLVARDIPRSSGILTERELEITESHNASSLLSGLAAGTFTSVEVTLAFSKRAAIAQQLVDELLDGNLFEQAEERARHLDDLRLKGNPLGPLHGFPVSIKDSFQVEGTEASIGAVALLGRKSTGNSALVDLLLDLGAVLYVKTNVPQVLMTVESDNNIFGRTLNPWNTSLTAGGSSGGEGALLAFRGSPLGVGTDLGGSIRIPSLCCGTYGFRPSSGRIPFGRQVMPLNAGIGAIVPTAGPMANDMSTLQVFMKAVIDAKPFVYDAASTHIPWRSINEPPHAKLRLGLLPEDPLFPLHPPVRDTITSVVSILESNGHVVIPLDVAECHIAEASQISGRLLDLDQTPASIIKSGEVDAMDRLEQFGALQNQRSAMAESWRKLWVKHDLDAIIAPSAQTTAMEHGQHGWPAYTMFLNMLDYPACAIPFGKATRSETSFTTDQNHCTPAYNPDTVEGAPCSVQVFTNRMRDEECLAVAAVVDACLRGDTAAH